MELDDAFGHWLAGFFDGEGHLGIHRDNAGPRALARGVSPTFRCIASIHLRADDEPILLDIAERTGLGYITRQKRRYSRMAGAARSETTSRWWLTSKPDCAQLVALFERYPLRAKKARDFAIWRIAVEMLLAPPPHDWTALAELHEALRTERAYAPPRSTSARFLPSRKVALALAPQERLWDDS